MIKNNIFRGILYTFLATMMVFAGILAIEVMGGTLDMPVIELYEVLGYKGLLILAGMLFFGINTFVFAIDNYKQFIYNAANKVDTRKAGKKIAAKVYKMIIATLFVASLVVLFVMVINPVDIVLYADVRLAVFTVLTVIAAILLFIFEFVDMLLVIKKNKGPKKPKVKKPKVKKVKKGKEFPVELKATEKQEKPVFKFGKK